MAEQNTTTTQALLHVNLSLWWTHPNHPSDLDNNQETVNFDNRIHVVDIVLHCIYQGHKKLYTCHQWNSSNNPNTQLNLHQTWIATPNHPCWIPKWYDFWSFFSTLLPLCLHCPHWCTYYTALSTWYQRPDHSLWKYTLTLGGTVGSGYLSSPSPNIHRVPCHLPGLHLHHWNEEFPNADWSPLSNSNKSDWLPITEAFLNKESFDPSNSNCHTIFTSLHTDRGTLLHDFKPTQSTMSSYVCKCLIK